MLTPKQEQFCQEYLIDLNATQAAIRAGYSPKAANRVGSRMLSKIDILARIQKLREERSDRTAITADQVITALARIANLDPRWLYAPDGNLIPPEKLPEDVALGVAGIEHGDKGGIKIRLNDRMKALELLGRHFGLFTDKVETSIRQAGTVTIYLPDNGRDATGSDSTVQDCTAAGTVKIVSSND